MDCCVHKHLFNYIVEPVSDSFQSGLVADDSTTYQLAFENVHSTFIWNIGTLCWTIVRTITKGSWSPSIIKLLESCQVPKKTNSAALKKLLADLGWELLHDR